MFDYPRRAVIQLYNQGSPVRTSKPLLQRLSCCMLGLLCLEFARMRDRVE